MAESDSLPFMNSTGLIRKILNKIIEAQTPPKFTQDFQATKLGYGSGSAKSFIPLLKRIGFLTSDGTPTELYKRFRNSATRGFAMADGLKAGYAPLYAISDYAQDLDSKKLKDAVIQVTGHHRDSSSVSAITGTFNALKDFADFNQVEQKDVELTEVKATPAPTISPSISRAAQPAGEPSINRGMNLSYTINLNLPETKDPEVFDAIFTSLKAKLLS